MQMRLIQTLKVGSVLVAFTLAGCTPERFDEPICQSATKLSPEQRSSPFASGYFPEEYSEPSLSCGFPGGPRPIVGKVESEWYPSQWQAAGEPSFFELAQCTALPEFALRFSYIPSFDPSVFIRVQADGDGLKLIAKEMTFAGGYEPGKIGRSKKKLG